ncbi:hypothetical protein DPM19_09370 [Actinomadura craniellae]|uniref:Uncharacterized protein n=1 Tax=Actinomadura craniellae TaxID=2231787 RepID=A0A365HAB6_9ACTN|nr:hypothetical protein DPM19_09370 [Actinomadura craniellae]
MAALRTAGFTIAPPQVQNFPAGGQTAAQAGTALTTLLRAPVAHITLFNIDLDGVHICVLEKHPNGNALLSQGYRGTYLPWWWQGLTRTALPAPVRLALGDDTSDRVLEMEVTDGPIAAHAAALTQVHADYGGEQNLAGTKFNTLTRNLGTLIALDYWGGTPGVARPATVAAWAALPFSPNDSTVIGTSGRAGEVARNTVRAIVTSHAVTGMPHPGDTAAARAALGVPAGDFLTAMVIRSAKHQIDLARYGAAVTAALP